MFLLEGNSSPYLQYTYARALSVLRKAGDGKPPSAGHEPMVGEEELPLLRAIYQFPEAVEDALQSHSPNLLGNYLFELAQRFNRFYAAASIIKAEENRDLRLALTGAAAQVLKNGLTLLGIEAPERL
ncbi:MAG: DALR anticodon-binding domain-containing protein, partial [bacterium]|nr:DALR anticodon-binding domain-containing protein [bacterium]